MQSTSQEQIDRLADKIIGELKSAGLKILRYNAYSTNSVYLKFDYGMCHSLRISDHKGKKHLRYKYNILINNEIDKKEIIMSAAKGQKPLPMQFYPKKAVGALIAEIIEARNSKIESMGEKMYFAKRQIMKAEGRDKPGFWRTCKEV